MFTNNKGSQSSLKMLISLSLFILMAYSVSIKPQPLTMDYLKSIRSYSLSTFDFIILDNSLITEQGYIDTDYLPVARNIRYKITDCSDKLLTFCEPHRNVPIVLIYNKVIMEYEQGWIDKYGKNQNYQSSEYKESMKNSIRTWANKIIQAKYKKDVSTKQIIQEIVEQKQSVYIMVQNKTINQNQIGFDTLSKNFFTENFIYYTDIQLAESLDLNLTEGKFVHITKDGKYNQFPLVSKPTYQLWQAFVKQQRFWNIGSINHKLAKDRFQVQNMKTIKQTIVFCDMGIPCLNFMTKLNQQIRQQQNEEMKTKANIIDQRSAKNVKIIELYYHIKLTSLKLPAVIAIDGYDQRYPNVPARYKKQLPQDKSPITQIKQFWKGITEQQIKGEFLSAGILKKNGYFGKGSQKNIQKLSFQTYKRSISDAFEKQASVYFLFITAKQFDCSKCEQIYSELKKFASYLKAQDRTDIKFGVFDLSNNQIDLQSIQSLPSMLVFKTGSINKETLAVNSELVKTYKGSYMFDSLYKFVKEQNDQIKGQQL